MHRAQHELKWEAQENIFFFGQLDQCIWNFQSHISPNSVRVVWVAWIMGWCRQLFFSNFNPALEDNLFKQLFPFQTERIRKETLGTSSALPPLPWRIPFHPRLCEWMVSLGPLNPTPAYSPIPPPSPQPLSSIQTRGHRCWSWTSCWGVYLSAWSLAGIIPNCSWKEILGDSSLPLWSSPFSLPPPLPAPNPICSRSYRSCTLLFQS